MVGATITLTDKATNSARTATSNEAGRYAFSDVTPGVYDIKITMKGFRQFLAPRQNVLVGETLTINPVMEVGSVTEIVEVQAVIGAELQTENATMGSTVSGDMLLMAPALDRDASSILTYQPATAPANSGGDIYGGQVAGSMSDQNTYMLDGGNITSDLEGDNNYTNNGTGGRGAIPTPIESIEELKVSTNNQTADFSASAGGQVSMVTKRGTDAFHGSAYEFYQAQFLNANTWDNNRFSEPRVKFHDNRFGGSVGGPMLPGNHLGGKTYFFAFYEGHRYPGQASFLEWAVPSALMRQGILQVKNPDTGAVSQYNLATSTACGASGGVPCDPRGIGINPLVSAMWSKYEPLPNDPTYNANGADGLNIQGYRAALALPVKDDYVAGRIDHDFGEKWRWMTSYRYQRLVNLTTNQVDIGGTSLIVFFMRPRQAPTRLTLAACCRATNSAFPRRFPTTLMTRAMAWSG
jgi:hypothetical protein